MSHPLQCIHRLEGGRASIHNPSKVPVTLFAREDVCIEADAMTQLLALTRLQDTLEAIATLETQGRIAPFWGEEPGSLSRIVLTPDFHRGAGIPVGTVIDARGMILPGAVGNDVSCGMRLLVTDLPWEALDPHWKALGKRLRAIFFQGARDIPMSARQRESMLRDGLWGMLETHSQNANRGLWRWYDPGSQLEDLDWTHAQGAFPVQGNELFLDLLEGSGAVDARDPQIGSLGGGNHFVELQGIDQILEGGTAHLWGAQRGNLAIMVHSGSVGLGHTVGRWFGGQARSLFPKGMPHPDHGFYALPTRGPHAATAERYLQAMRNAANFAFGNRLFLGLMALRAIEETTGRSLQAKLVHDAPHNLIWPLAEHRYLHRKGATPALGRGAHAGPFEYTGHPVIIPGSMGATSHVMAGEGLDGALDSACHGAGRALNRGRAAHVSEATYRDSTERLRIITPIDPEAHDVRHRRDILESYHHRLKEEAPHAYKPITPVIQTVAETGIARHVAQLRPLLTIKG